MNVELDVWATSYTSGMVKCAPLCSCKRHSPARTKCPPQCPCGRHLVSEKRRRNISEARKGAKLSEAQRAALKCPPGCACKKHGLRNSGQFKDGGSGFTGHHTAETRAKLASYNGEKASNYKHGWAATPTYTTWSSMHSRCRDPRNRSYVQYGARGITVCERWDSFENFLEDMGKRPSQDHQIDRRDPDGIYEPENCRWLTRAENNARRRDPGGWIARRTNGAAQ